MFRYEGQTETEHCSVGLCNLMSRMASEDEGIIGYRKSKKKKEGLAKWSPINQT